jgi:hypothetical protein
MLQSSSQLSLRSEVRCSHLPPISHGGRAIGLRNAPSAIVSVDAVPVEITETVTVVVPGQKSQDIERGDHRGLIPAANGRFTPRRPGRTGLWRRVRKHRLLIRRQIDRCHCVAGPREAS